MKSPAEEPIRILIVDDDDEEAVFFTEKLKDLNLSYEVCTALSCSDLFECLDSRALPHVIFMDINMPLPNGHECVKKLKAHPKYRDIPVVMYSLSDSARDIDTAYAAGAHYYVVKPHALVNLGPTLRKAFTPDWRKPQAIPERSEFVIDLSY